MTDPSPAVRAFADRVVALAATPGLVVGTTDRDRTLDISAHGLAKVDAGVPMGADSIGQIGSISKSFTVLRLLQEVEAGHVDLHAPVHEYLPWFGFGDERITTHHLLTHTAGLPSGTEPAPPSRGHVALLAGERPVWEPGERYWYSNTGYVTVGLVLEAVTGITAAEAVRAGVLEPLGMSGSSTAITHRDRLRMPDGHVALDPSQPWRVGAPLAPAPWIESESADGSICAPVEDMLRYARALLGGGGGVVRPESLRLMTDVAVPDDEGSRYGYGLRVWDLDGRRAIGHSGGMVGFVASLQLDPEAGLGAVALANGPTGAGAVAEHALRCLRAAAERRPPPQPYPYPVEERPAPPADPAASPELAPYTGGFRSHTPWNPHVEVYASAGRLWARSELGAHELVHEGVGDWRMTTDGRPLPELLRFDLPVEGQCERLTWTGCLYLRAMEA